MQNFLQNKYTIMTNLKQWTVEWGRHWWCIMGCMVLSSYLFKLRTKSTSHNLRCKLFRVHFNWCCSVAKSCLTLCDSWTACQASLSFTISWSLLIFMYIGLVMLSNHLILCRPLLLLPSIFPGIKLFPNESALCIRWPKYWSFSFSISPSNEYSGLDFL